MEVLSRQTRRHAERMAKKAPKYNGKTFRGVHAVRGKTYPFASARQIARYQRAKKKG
jgi:hypothetical protein